MKSFEPNCTLPSSDSFVEGPNVRGTLNIVWSCLAIILLCTWSIQHLNVPVQVTTENRCQSVLSFLYLPAQQAKWMLLTVLAPEVITGKALADFLSALHNKTKMKDVARRDGIKWTLTHAFLADMGGFAIVFPPLPQPNSAGPQEDGDANVPNVNQATEKLRKILKSRSGIEKWKFENFYNRNERAPYSSGTVNWHRDVTKIDKATHALQNENVHICWINSGSAQEYWQNLAALQGNIWILDANQLYLAWEYKIIRPPPDNCGIIRLLPDASKDDLKDRNKSDALVILLAIIQLFWLIAELITRKIKGLTSSQLEIVTLAFAACSIASYILVLPKPKGVNVTQKVRASQYPTAPQMAKIAGGGPFCWQFARQVHWIPNHAIHYQGPSWRYFRGFTLGSGFGAMLFGAAHTIAWNFDFPTPVERTLWRVAAIVTIGVPFLSFLWSGLAWLSTEYGFLQDYIGLGNRHWYHWVAISIMGGGYLLSRLFILVEIFRTLYFLPPRTYVATWATNYPYGG